MRRPLPLVVLAALAVSAAARPAAARPTKVALTQIDGDTTGIWMAMEDALDDKSLQVVPTRHVTHVIERLGLAEDLAGGDIKKLAAELEVDAIVQGVFEPHTRKVRFTIFAKGRRGKPFNLPAGNAGSAQFRKQVHTTMLAKLAAAMAAEPAAADPDDTADDEARSPKAKKAGKQTSPKDDDETAAEASDSGKKARKTKKTKDADEAEAVAETRDGGKKAKKGAKDSKADSKAKAAKADDDVVEIVDADDGPEKPARAKKTKDTEPAAKAEDDGSKKAKGKAKSAKAPDAQVADAGDPPRSARKEAKPKATGEAAAADGDSAKPAKPTKKADDAVEVAGSSAPEAKEAKEAKEPRAQKTAAAEATPDESDAPAVAPRAAAKQVAERDTERDTDRDAEATPAARARFEPSSPVIHSANLAGVRVDFGASLSTRDLRFQTTALANPPKAYTNAPVPGGRVEGALYPFALGNPSGWLAGIGVAGDFDQTAALTLRTSAEMTVPLKVTERHYSFGLRYRLAFGHTPTSPTLTFGGGYGRRTFVVNRTGLMTTDSLDLPDVDYKLFDPGLAFRLPLGGRLALTLEGRALLVTAAGPIQRVDQYGRATIPGGTASAGLEILFSSHVALRLAAEATQFNYKFAGTGTLATGRDGDPATLDVRRATDRYLGGAGTLAVFY